MSFIISFVFSFSYRFDNRVYSEKKNLTYIHIQIHRKHLTQNKPTNIVKQFLIRNHHTVNRIILAFLLIFVFKIKRTTESNDKIPGLFIYILQVRNTATTICDLTNLLFVYQR